METNYIALSVPVFFVLIGLELAWSAWKGYGLYTLSDSITNISCGIGQQLTGILFKTALFFLYYWLYEHARIFSIPSSGFWWIALFILVDFCYYWFHRMGHEINAIWATHIVHHQSEEYNLTVALRQSWFQGFFSSLFYLPLAILGFDPLVTITVIAFNTLYQFWIHTELIRTMGWFELIFNSPSHHRVHHGSNPEYIDKNHGGTLIIWDRLFGTFAAEKAKVVYGITTQFRSWNPFVANVHYWNELIQTSRHIPGFFNKIRLFFMLPGQYPEGFISNDEVRVKVQGKYTVLLNRRVQVFVLVQFLVVLGFSAAVLMVSANERISDLLPVLAWTVFSLFSFSSLLENRPNAFIIECITLILFPLALLLSVSILTKFWIVGLLYSMISLCWLFWLKHVNAFVQWSNADKVN